MVEDSDEKQAVTFRPKRQWKPRRRERNQQERMKRKRRNLRNRAKRKQYQKKRYRQLKNNPTYKRWQKKKRKEKNRKLYRSAAKVASLWIESRQQGRDTVYRDPRITEMSLRGLDLDVSYDLFEKRMRSMAESVGAYYQDATNDIIFPDLEGFASYDRLRVLYRILPDGTGQFDVIPSKGGRLLPRAKAAASFRGPLSDLSDTYREFIQWLRRVLSAVTVYQRQQMRRNGNVSNRR